MSKAPATPVDALYAPLADVDVDEAELAADELPLAVAEALPLEREEPELLALALPLELPLELPLAAADDLELLSPEAVASDAETVAEPVPEESSPVVTRSPLVADNEISTPSAAEINAEEIDAGIIHMSAPTRIHNEYANAVARAASDPLQLRAMH